MASLPIERTLAAGQTNGQPILCLLARGGSLQMAALTHYGRYDARSFIPSWLASWLAYLK